MKNISNLNRVFRLALSLGIVISVLNMTGPVGAFAYVLFLSIYTGITAFIGWDPAIAVMNYLHEKVAAKSSHDHHNGMAAH